jgi:hypothetical protein
VAALSSLLLIPAGSTPAIAVDGGGTIVTGSAAFSSHVRRFNSAAAAQDGGGFFAFSHLNLKGVNVATGDVNGDGKQDIVVGDGGNGDPNNIAAAGDVKVLNANGTEITHFAPYGNTWGGAVNVAVSDLDGASDNRDEIITGAGPGGGPHVKVFKWNGSAVTEIASFFAYDTAFHGGVFVAGGDLEVITGAGAGGGPHVKLFSPNQAGAMIVDHQFFAYDGRFFGGVRVGTGDFNNDGLDDIVTGPGPGGGPDVRTFQFESTGTPDTHFMAYDGGFVGGVYVAGLGVPGTGGDQIITGAGAGGGPHVKIFNSSGNAVASFFAYDAKYFGGVTVAGVRNPGADSPPTPTTTSTTAKATTTTKPSTTTTAPTTTTTLAK